MPFFDEPEPPPRRQQRRLRRDEHGRPTLFVPGYLSEDVVLAVSDEVAVVMQGIACYPRGFAFELATTSRYEVPLDEEDQEDLHGAFGLWRPRRPSARFGIEYSDGRRATLGENWSPMRSMPAKEQLSIEPGGGGGGAGHWAQELWVQPLPPAGPVTFAVEWPSRGIDETLHTIDGELFRQSADRARDVFPPRR